MAEGEEERVAAASRVGAPAEEWFDVVDAANRVIDRAPRDVVHREGLRHRSVHVLLLDGAGRVFVQRRSAAKDVDPGLWDTSAAGHVDSGESYLDAAVRELGEELGLEVAPGALERTGLFEATPETGNEFAAIYRVSSDAPLTLDAREVAEGRWLEPAALDAWLRRSPEDFTVVFRAVWQNARPVVPD